MNYISVCAGIEAATCAWHALGWRPWAFSEIEPFPCAVLAHHYPTVPNLGDMTRFKEWPDATLDLLVGGTPCQSFSIAGLRKGLADPRGNLMLTYLAIAQRYRPRWLVWENVPGVLSSGGGRDFGCLLAGLAKLGYGFAYRILDAQYFGVPQRRRRVFVVGYLGDWRRAAAVLFERASLQGNPAPRREAGQEVAGTISARSTAGGGLGTDFELSGGVIGTLNCSGGHAYPGQTAQDASAGFLIPAIAKTHTRGGQQRLDWESETLIPTIGGGFDVAHALRGEGFDASEDGKVQAIAFDSKASGRNGFAVGEVSPTLRSMSHANSHANAGGQVAVAHHIGIRRLTPRECERLQGFPDDYTLIPVRGKPAADGPRYKALGNSMAVPVMRWIGERIAQVEAIPAHEEAA